ncbi:MAG TPA: hypothetical protein VHD87_16235 [Acidimicrobiales bacterium]|nr:hypothetical protein [Acidimicrobiales bacterium]
MKRILGLLCVAALVLTGACGKFSTKKASTTTLLGDGTGVGSGLTVPTTAVPVTAGRSATTAAPAAPKCPYTDPTSEIVYSNRIKLTFTVSTLCPKHADDIAFNLKVTNVSSTVVHYDKNQSQFFSLLAYPQGSGRIRWEDTNCQPNTGNGQTPAGDLAPGQTLSFDGTYPAAKSVGDRERCRRLEDGGYSANAVFLVCDDDAYTDGYCDISKDNQFKAEPVLINVGS